MGAINNLASVLNQSIDVSIAYLKENAVAILVLVMVWKYLISSFRERNPNGWSSSGYSLSSQESEKETNSGRQEEMRKVRQRQQEIADKRAQEAAAQRKEKQQKEKQRKNEAALLKHEGGRRLRDGSRTNTTTTSSSNRLRSNDYNPMQPWNTGTSGFRPSARTPPRGAS